MFLFLGNVLYYITRKQSIISQSSMDFFFYYRFVSHEEKQQQQIKLFRTFLLSHPICLFNYKVIV